MPREPLPLGYWQHRIAEVDQDRRRAEGADAPGAALDARALGGYGSWLHHQWWVAFQRERRAAAALE